VQLLTLALRGKADAAGFLRQSSGMHRFLREYVSEEILGQQDAEMQNFLLHTCLLEQLCGPLCDAVRGETGSKKLLEELRKANLFVSVLDETSIWYRYHPLFAEALAAHLREQEPERIPELYLRASLWYEDQQRPEKAYEYAFLAGDFTRAVTLLEKLSPYLFERGEFLRMRQWLTQLPSELITASPLLSLASIWTHSSDQSIPGGANKAVKMLIAHLEQQIEMHAQDTESSWAELSNVLPLVRAWEALAQGNAALMITLANQISPVYTHPESALSRFIAVNRRMLLGTAYRASGNLEASEQMHLETVQSEESRADHRPSLSAAPNLVELYEARGQLRKLGQFYDNLFRETTQRTDLFPPLLALMQARSAALYYEWNQLTEAETRARQALELVERLKLPMPTIALFSRWVQMRIALVRGDNEKARTLLTQAEQHLTTNHYFPDLTKKSRDTISVRFALTNGQLEQAERWEREQGLRFDDPLPSQLSRHDYLDYVTLARILIARGRLQRNSAALVQALILLDHLRDIAASRYLHGWHRETQVLTALALQAQGKVRQALFTLGPILTQAEAEGYVRLFADEGQPMAYLLAQIADFTWASSDYIGQIQAAFVLTKWTAADLARQPFRDPLSSREQEVLRLVANGCSNQQIAQQLVISQHTVKLHIKHIFAKLMVTNRTQAVAQARELNLL
jgi:LuxR family maltose regulon positive regulatory protein